MQRRTFLNLAAGASAATLLSPNGARAQNAKPNIIVILADDIGYGDTGPYGATKVKTPNLDRMAAQGLRFTNAYCSSATCTPTRYSLLTGRYAFRKEGSGVLPGNAPLLIEPGQPTIASVLKGAGYATGVVGKWHLGLGNGNVDWNGVIKPGPAEIGFDYSFLIPATGDRTPCVYTENDRVFGLDPKDPITVQYGKPIPGEPTGVDNPGMLRWHPSHGHDMTIVNGISRIGYMKGGHAARWVDEGMADTITRKASNFIDAHANKEKPFFLFFATHDVHVPRVPHPRFQGKSECGIRCDATVQFDWSVGQVLEALDRNDIAENTLVIFTSDNGAVIDDGYEDGAFEDLNGHMASGPLRGGKYSIYEGGTRMPFLLRWPQRVKPGVSDAVVSQVDLLASFAALTGATLPNEAGPDSLNHIQTLLGESGESRSHVVEHANLLAIRQGKWKYIPGGGRASGSLNWNGGNRPANAPQELYDLANDIGERNNIAAQHPQVAKRLAALLEKVVKDGRSRQ
ncbi:MAG: arylsulfatase [Bryobacterales bacterium]|nr:arylsulfatase [Bryobacterales bacterium]